MFKNLLLFASFLLSFQALNAQLNMTYKSNVTYDESLNDIWGYAAPDEREYAIVGLIGGVSIIDVTDTENPVIKGYIPGANSTWRDIKTWGTHAYVTNETSGGVLVIDLSNLPNDITEDDFYYWDPELPAEYNGDISSCHNIYIDEFGYAYLAGCDANSGGLIFVDVVTTPGVPILSGKAAAVYSHDVYTRDNLAYSSEIFEGHFAIYDVTDKSNPTLINNQNTAFNFTHNAWLSDDSNIIFTTDEQANAPVGAYDISDLNNIETLDQFRPLETLGDGVVPHNVHVWNDWLIISYYSDGCIIVDGSRPENLIEVGNFDTFIPSSTGFSGAWGAYPYLPSGTVLVSDIGNGCYILEPNYVRACWLEGQVTDINTTDVINNVKVEMVSSQLANGTTNFNGEYATGLATAGTYEVMFSHPGYLDLTASATMNNGVVTILNVQMTPLPSQAVTGQVVRASDNSPIEGAAVFLRGEVLDYEVVTDANGNFNMSSVLEGDYAVFAGKWGFVNNEIPESVAGGPSDLVIALEDGYADDFIVDLGWTVTGNAQTGSWERGEPIGTTNQGGQSNTDEDIAGDIGDYCYVTGNAGGTAGFDDIDNGNTRLTSPTMDLTTYVEPRVRMNYWFYNPDNNNSGPANDALVISVSNGIATIPLISITESNQTWQDPIELDINNFIGITDEMSIIIDSGDDNNGHLVEAAIDVFEVYDAMPVNTFEPQEVETTLLATPNPFKDVLQVSYQLPSNVAKAELQVLNVLGQTIQTQTLTQNQGSVAINAIPESGVYFISIQAEGHALQTVKVVKE